MSESSEANPIRSRAGLIGFLVLASAAAVLFFYQLDEKDIWERTEGRSALIAREMVDSSNYLVPKLFDRPFLDNRPPGYYWLVAAVYRVTGDQSEFTARIPSALAAFVCVIVIYMFGSQLHSPRAGFWAGVVLLGTIKFTWQARLAEQDMLLAMWTCLGYWTFWIFLDESGPSGSRRSRWGWLVAFQVLIGLGAMTKGPAIGITLVLPIVFYLLLSGRWRDVHWRGILATSPIAFVLSLWWFVYVWFAMPAEQAQLIGRFANQSGLHVRAFYYYILKLPVLLGPLILLLPLLWSHWRNASSQQRRGYQGYLLSWFLGTIVIFSLFSSKQTHYLVPAFPGLALALGTVLAQPQQTYRVLQNWFVAMIIACLIVAPVVWMIVVPATVEWSSDSLEWITYAAVYAAAMFLGWSLWTGRVSLAYHSSWACWLLALGTVLGHVIPQLDTQESPRRFADKVEETLPSEARLGVLSQHSGVAFYLDEPVVVLKNAALARKFLEDSQQHYLIVKSDELEDEFKNFQPAGTEVVIKQSGFMKRHVTAYLLRKPVAQSRLNNSRF